MNTTTKHTTQYKNSPLGLIPEDWELKLFSEVFDYINTPSFSRDNLTNEKTEKEVKYIHYGDIHSTFKSELLDVEKVIIPYLKDEFVDESKLNYLTEGDLVIADASEDYKGIGECIELKNVKNTKIIGGLHTIVARSRDNQTHNGFRTYIFNSHLVSKSLKTIATGISVYGISKGNLSKLKLPIPPRPEQKAIADCLSTWDKAIEKQNALITQKELSKKALMQQLLSGKKRVKGFEDQKGTHKTDFGYKIPKDWQIVTVSDLFVERHDKSNDQNEYPLFSLTIENGLTEKTERYERSFLLKDKENNQYRIVCPDDILFNPMNLRFGAIAKSEIDYKVLVSGYYNVISVKDNFVNVNYFIELFKTAEFSNFYDRIAIGSLMEKKRVHLSNFLKLQVPLPSFEEQNCIAKVLQSADDELQLLKKKLEQLKEQKKGLMQVLLTGKKRLKY